MIQAIGLLKYANGVTVTKTLREVTGLSLYECKEMSDILRRVPVLTVAGAYVKIVPFQMPNDVAVDLLVRTGIILLIDDVPVSPAQEIDLLRQEMRSQIERMAATLDGVVSWRDKEEAE